MGQRLSARVSGWVTGPHKLHALKLDPGVIGCPVESAMLKHLSQERNNTLGVWKKNLKIKQYCHLSQTPSITQDIVAAFTYCIYPC